MDEETARRVCSLIAGVLCADDEMSPEERQFLKRLLEKCGLPTDTALVTTQHEDVAAELARLPESTRWRTLHLVIEAAAADGVIVPAERAMVDVIAAELGVDESDVVAQLSRALTPEPQ